MEPLRYQWFKNDRKLEVATADSPQLILVEVTARDAGAYYCQASGRTCLVTRPRPSPPPGVCFAMRGALKRKGECGVHARPQVSNKDGSVNSAKATLVVDRVPRAARAAGGTHVTDEVRARARDALQLAQSGPGA